MFQAAKELPLPPRTTHSETSVASVQRLGSGGSQTLCSGLFAGFSAVRLLSVIVVWTQLEGIPAGRGGADTVLTEEAGRRELTRCGERTEFRRGGV